MNRAISRERNGLQSQVHNYKTKWETECKERKEERRELDQSKEKLKIWKSEAHKCMTMFRELDQMHADHQLALVELQKQRGEIENKTLYITHVRSQLDTATIESSDAKV